MSYSPPLSWSGGFSLQIPTKVSFCGYILWIGDDQDDQVTVDDVGVTEFDDLPIPTQEDRAKLSRLTRQINSVQDKEIRKAQWILAVSYG